jgi:hypothetical protein
MKGKVNDGDLVTVKPLGDHVVQQYDIVLCRAKGHQYLHQVLDIKVGIEGCEFHYLIGNNKGGTNGWVTREKIYGVMTSVEA